ncbi:MAG: hypothetical protein QW512_00525 [Thermofilaceae archaeon]
MHQTTRPTLQVSIGSPFWATLFPINLHLFGAAKRTPQKIIDPRVGVDKSEEVEVQFEGKNLTCVGEIGLIRKFVSKLEREKALEQPSSFKERPAGTPQAAALMVCAFVLDLIRLSNTQFLSEDKVA